MHQEQIQAAIARVLLQATQEPGAEFYLMEKVRAPYCSLDLESYRLLHARSKGSSYPELFTDAVRMAISSVTDSQLSQSIQVVQKKRSRGQGKIVRPKIGKSELDWVEGRAKVIDAKPARVLEAVLFLFLRIELLSL